MWNKIIALIIIEVHQFFIYCLFNWNKKKYFQIFHLPFLFPIFIDDFNSKYLLIAHQNTHTFPYQSLYTKILISLTFSPPFQLSFISKQKKKKEFEKDRINTGFLLISTKASLSRIEHCVMIDHPFKDIVEESVCGSWKSCHSIELRNRTWLFNHARCATGSFRSIQPFFFFPHSILSLSLTHAHARTHRPPEYPARVARNTLPPPWLRIRNLDIALGKALLPNCRDIADPLFSLFLEHEWKIGKDEPRSIYLFPTALMRFQRAFVEDWSDENFFPLD